MTAFTETFTGREDRARVLTEILSRAPATPGTTIVAHVDRASLAVTAVRCFTTPDPVVDAGLYFADGPIQRLSDLLRHLAQQIAPDRTWTGERWSEMTGELVTVVCREGETTLTPVEMQFHFGWRYSNHLTAAFHGDVYVVTPRGWAALLGAWCGSEPALAPVARPLDAVPAVQDAERILADASAALLDPDPGECVLCYVHRMLALGCNGQLRFASHYRDARAPRATRLERRLEQKGGFCDCEIFLNGYDLLPEHRPSGYPLPECMGVRAGSTQPCALWWRRQRW